MSICGHPSVNSLCLCCCTTFGTVSHYHLYINKSKPPLLITKLTVSSHNTFLRSALPFLLLRKIHISIWSRLFQYCPTLRMLNFHWPGLATIIIKKLTQNVCILLFSFYGIGQTIIFSSCRLFFFFLSSFFSSPNLSRRRLDVYHTSTHANLEGRSEVYYTRLAENTGCKNRQKIAISAPSHNFVWLYLRN